MSRHCITIASKCSRLAGVVGLLLFSVGSMSCVQPEALDPTPGLLDFQAPLWIDVPEGRVNLAGGNLVVQRVDLRIDTLFGELGIGATYNSSRQSWLWSFDIRYDGALFVDETGAEHDVTGLAPGAAIPGTHWVMLDDRRIKTKGGLVHSFDPVTHRLSTSTWQGHPLPSLSQVVAPTPAGDRVVAITQCRGVLECQDVFRIAYDEHGCVERIDDRAGRTALFEHDASCQTSTARDGLDVDRGWAGRRYEYLLGRLWEITNSEGERVQYAYADGRLVSARAAAETGSRISIRYGFDGMQGLFFAGVTDPTGAYTLHRHDAAGRLHERIGATGERTRMGWLGRRPSSRTDPAGLVTSWEWADDDPIRVHVPSGNVIVLEYAAGAQDRRNPRARPLLRISDAVGVVEERGYYANGQVSEILNGAGDRTGFSYDGEGNRNGWLAPGGVGRELRAFGDHGHAAELWQAGYQMHRVFDEVGNLLEGESTGHALDSSRPGIGRRSYDADRNWVSVELAGGQPADPFVEHSATLRVDYRSDGQPVSVSRPHGGDTALAYDGLGRLVSRRERVDGAWQETRTEYDARGLVTAVERPNSMRVENEYDRAGRPVMTRLMRDGIVKKTMHSSFLDGRLELRDDTSYVGVESLHYDAAGRPDVIVFPGGETLEIDYDVRSRVVERRYLDSSGLTLRTLAMQWDDADRVVSIEDDGASVLEKEWVDGLERTIRYGNGLVRDMTYDELTRVLRESRTLHVGGALVEEMTTIWAECATDQVCMAVRTGTFDRPLGLPWTVSEEAFALGVFTPNERLPGEFGMRLLNWIELYDTEFAATGFHRQAYDVLGNRIGVASSAALEEEFHYNAERNRLVAADLPAHRDYAWDEAGYMVGRDAVDILWDAGGRIAQVGEDISLEWDVLGRPVRSNVQGQEMRALFGGAVLADSTGTPRSIDLGEVKIDLVLGERIYRHYDFRGNVKWVSGEGGEVLLHYAYGPWGVESKHGTHPDGLSFARGQALGDFLLVGARIYDPETGRFISPDPLGHVVNLYAYTHGNPVMFWDPGGLWARPVGYQAPAREANLTTAQKMELANVFSALGIAIASAGIIVGMPPVVFAGLSMVGAATIFKIHAMGPPGATIVEIIDLTPGQPNFEAPKPQAGSGSEAVPAPSCAPVGRSGHSGLAWWSVLLAPSQLGIAVLLARALRRGHGSG